MIRYEFTDDHGNKWYRVNKHRARRAFEQGERLVFCASNMRPFGPWHPEVEVTHDIWHTFDELVTNFEVYNCSNEQGNYTSFYMTEV